MQSNSILQAVSLYDLRILIDMWIHYQQQSIQYDPRFIRTYITQINRDKTKILVAYKRHIPTDCLRLIHDKLKVITGCCS